MTQAVRAGRVLVFLIAIGCILIFAGLARRIFRNRRVALLATVAFALSGGVAVHLPARNRPRVEPALHAAAAAAVVPRTAVTAC